MYLYYNLRQREREVIPNSMSVCVAVLIIAIFIARVEGGGGG